jgi:predicted signal transduction protein with EAL and GGDEF domain
MGCDQMQGYRFGRPVPAEAMREMLMNGFANPVEVDLTDLQAMSEGIAD